MREGDTPSCRWGSGGLPREFFLTIDANGAFLAHFLVEFVLTPPPTPPPPPPIVCDFCLQNSDRDAENFHPSCRGSYKEKDDSFYSVAVGGGRGLPEKILKNGCKRCILSSFFADCMSILFPCNFFLSKLQSRKHDFG